MQRSRLAPFCFWFTEQPQEHTKRLLSAAEAQKVGRGQPERCIPLLQPPVLIPLAFPHHTCSECCCPSPCLPRGHRVSPTNTVCPPQPHKAPAEQLSKGMGALTHTAEPRTPPRAPGAAQPYLGGSELLGMKAKSRRGKKSLGPIIPKPLVRFGCILQGVGERCRGCQPCRTGSSVRPPPSSPSRAGSRLTGNAAPAGRHCPAAKIAFPWPGAATGGREVAPRGRRGRSPCPVPVAGGGLSASRCTPLTAGLPPATDSLAKYLGKMVLWASLSVPRKQGGVCTRCWP